MGIKFVDFCCVGIFVVLAIAAACLMIDVLFDMEELKRFEKRRIGKK